MNNFFVTMLVLALLSQTVPVSAQAKITCPNGENRYQVDAKSLANQYNATSFQTTIVGLLGMQLKASVDARPLQQASAETQQWSQLMQFLAAGYNSCAISKEQFDEGLRQIYPRLQTNAKQLEEIRQRAAQGQAIDTKQLQGILANYSRELQSFAKAANTDLLVSIHADVQESKEEILEAISHPVGERDLPAGFTTGVELASEGDAYYFGTESTPKDYPKAFALYQEAVHQGNANAMYSLGKMYENGQATSVNWKSAFELYIRAAAVNEPRSLERLGVWYTTGVYMSGKAGVEPVNALLIRADCEQAEQYLRAAAEAGSVSAMLKLSSLLDEDPARGRGCRHDGKLADELMEGAAERGSIEAKNTLAGRAHAAAELLALKYLDGNGVQADFVKARALFAQIPGSGDEVDSKYFDGWPTVLYYQGRVKSTIVCSFAASCREECDDDLYQLEGCHSFQVTDLGIRLFVGFYSKFARYQVIGCHQMPILRISLNELEVQPSVSSKAPLATIKFDSEVDLMAFRSAILQVCSAVKVSVSKSRKMK